MSKIYHYLFQTPKERKAALGTPGSGAENKRTEESELTGEFNVLKTFFEVNTV